MAKLYLKYDEIIEIAKKNQYLPPQVSDIKATGNQIKITINPGKFVPNFSAIVNFDKYINDKIQLTVKTYGPFDLFLKFIKIPTEDWLEIDLPNIRIDINKQISKQLKGVQISDVIFKNDEFLITTKDSIL